MASSRRHPTNPAFKPILYISIALLFYLAPLASACTNPTIQKGVSDVCSFSFTSTLDCTVLIVCNGDAASFDFAACPSVSFVLDLDNNLICINSPPVAPPASPPSPFLPPSPFISLLTYYPPAYNPSPAPFYYPPSIFYPPISPPLSYVPPPISGAPPVAFSPPSFSNPPPSFPNSPNNAFPPPISAPPGQSPSASPPQGGSSPNGSPPPTPCQPPCINCTNITVSANITNRCSYMTNSTNFTTFNCSTSPKTTYVITTFNATACPTKWFDVLSNGTVYCVLCLPPPPPPRPPSPPPPRPPSPPPRPPPPSPPPPPLPPIVTIPSNSFFSFFVSISTIPVISLFQNVLSLMIFDSNVHINRLSGRFRRRYLSSSCVISFRPRLRRHHRRLSASSVNITCSDDVITQFRNGMATTLNVTYANVSVICYDADGTVFNSSMGVSLPFNPFYNATTANTTGSVTLSYQVAFDGNASVDSTNFSLGNLSVPITIGNTSLAAVSIPNLNVSEASTLAIEVFNSDNSSINVTPAYLVGSMASAFHEFGVDIEAVIVDDDGIVISDIITAPSPPPPLSPPSSPLPPPPPSIPSLTNFIPPKHRLFFPVVLSIIPTVEQLQTMINAMATAAGVSTSDVYIVLQEQLISSIIRAYTIFNRHQLARALFDESSSSLACSEELVQSLRSETATSLNVPLVNVSVICLTNTGSTNTTVSGNETIYFYPAYDVAALADVGGIGLAIQVSLGSQNLTDVRNTISDFSSSANVNSQFVAFNLAPGASISFASKLQVTILNTGSNNLTVSPTDIVSAMVTALGNETVRAVVPDDPSSYELESMSSYCKKPHSMSRCGAAASGAVAGTVIGSVMGGGALAGVAYYLRRKRRLDNVNTVRVLLDSGA